MTATAGHGDVPALVALPCLSHGLLTAPTSTTTSSGSGVADVARALHVETTELAGWLASTGVHNGSVHTDLSLINYIDDIVLLVHSEGSACGITGSHFMDTSALGHGSGHCTAAAH